MSSIPQLRVSFPNSTSAKAYDPSRIYLAPEYIFLENVFSPLVEFDKHGQIQSGVAERFEWDGDKARFSIRPNLKTIDGDPITARDAAASFKRLVILTENTHGNLKNLLCSDTLLEKLSDDCPGIEVEGNTLILQPTGKANGSMRQFFFPMLAAIDFAVIPSRAIDPKTLAITDYRNTSGPYFVEKDSSDGRIIWKANPFHYHYAKDIPQTIELIPSDPRNPGDSLVNFQNDIVDFISTVDKAPIDDIITFARGNNDSVLHTTMKIRTFIAFFTQNGREKLSPRTRFAIGKALKSVFVEKFSKQPGYEETNQVFPVFGEGGLKQEQAVEVKKHLDSVAEAGSGEGLTIRLVRISDQERIKALIVKKLPGIKVEDGQSVRFDAGLSASQFPEIEIAGPDTGFMEDIGLLSYSMAADHFGLGEENGRHWISEYMAIGDKAARLEKLRALHLQSLIKPVMVPLITSSYVALARKPWEIHLSKFYANNQFWLVRWKN